MTQPEDNMNTRKIGIINHWMVNNYGALWNAAGSVMYGLNSFIMLALVSRVGTVEEAGCFGIAFTTAQMLYIVGLFGVSHYQMTDYAERFPFSTYAVVRALTCILMGFCCCGAELVMGFDGIKRSYTVCLTALMMLNVIGELYQSLFFQKNRLDLSGSALFFRTLWPLMGFSGILVLSRNVLLAVAVQVGMNLAVTLWYRIRVVPRFLREPESGRSKVKAGELLKECVPLAVSLFLMNLVINMSKYGIEFVGDNTVQGYYSMIFMPAQVINMVGQFLFKPFLNQYAALLGEKKTKDFYELLKNQMLLIAGFTLVCCLGAYLLGAPVLGLLYNKDLSGFAVPLTLVVLGGGFFALCELFYFILVILREQSKILWIYLGAALISGALSPVMISAWGIGGAVLAFVLTHLGIVLCYFAVLPFVLHPRRP